MASRRILIVEDEQVLGRVVADVMKGAGYDVTLATDGCEGIELFSSFRPDLVIADVMMPRLGGLEMVKRMRDMNPATQFMFLSACGSAEDVVEGFKCGGNDYLRKPFAMSELCARVDALLSRLPAESDNGTVIAIGSYRLDSKLWRLSRKGECRHISPRESAILALLAANMGKVVESRELLLEIWGDDSYYNLRSLNVFISRLRTYLKDDTTIDISSVRGVGYRLICGK